MCGPVSILTLVRSQAHILGSGFSNPHIPHILDVRNVTILGSGCDKCDNPMPRMREM